MKYRKLRIWKFPLSDWDAWECPIFIPAVTMRNR